MGKLGNEFGSKQFQKTVKNVGNRDPNAQLPDQPTVDKCVRYNRQGCNNTSN